ncbi:MAG: DUF4874 domain-containing protein [Acutalibacteraceae bacterium]
MIYETTKPIKPMSYDTCEALLSNPDRGLRTETYITLGTPLRAYPTENEDPFERANRILLKYKEDSPTLCQLYVYLSNYVSSPLDSTAFEQLKEILQMFRNRNVRLLLRFAYSVEGIPDAKYKTVKRHLEQLKEFFIDNGDLINSTLYCLQTGIIGYWGEGHSNKKLKNRYKKRVVNDVHKLAPKGIYTQVRTYDMLKLLRPENKLKTGIHDDYIIGDMSHQWSFVPSTKKKQFADTLQHTKYTVNDGEMPWGRATLNDKPGAPSLSSLDGAAVLKQLSTYSMTSLSLEHNYREDGNEYSMAKWKTEALSYYEAERLGISVNPFLFQDKNGRAVRLSVYDIIRYHLGYQLILCNYVEKQQLISFGLTNYGFAAPLNFNYLAVVAKSRTTDEFIEIEITDFDKNCLQSGANVTYTATIPDGYEAVGVKADTFKGRGINLRFANDTPFLDGVQYFK